jgi:hypothetical protein
MMFMELEQFVKIDVLNEDQNNPFTIRFSDTLLKAIPDGVKRQDFFRRLLQMFFILRNSVYFQKILTHLGFNADLRFDRTKFEENFNEKFFGNHVSDKKPKTPDPELGNEISRLKEDMAILIQGYQIFTKVFTDIS